MVEMTEPRLRTLYLLAAALASAGLAALTGCTGGDQGDAGGNGGAGNQGAYVPTDPAHTATRPGNSVNPAVSTSCADLEALILDIVNAGAPLGDWVAEVGPLSSRAAEPDVSLSEFLARVRGYAARFEQAIASDPNDGAAQYGLALCARIIGLDEACKRAGWDLAAGSFIPPVLSGRFAAAANLASDSARLMVGLAGLVNVPARSLSGAVGTRAATIPGTLSTLGDLSAGANVFVGWLGDEGSGSGVIGRLAKLAESTSPIARITVLGYTIDIVPWMVQADLVTCHLTRALLLTLTAYNPDTGDWALPVGTDGELENLDQNGDGTATPAEYLPPSPFGELVSDGAARLASAKTSLTRASYWAPRAIDGARLDPLLGGSLSEADATGAKDLIAAISAVTDGPLALDFVTFDDATKTFVTSTVHVNLAPLLNGSIGDLKAFAPNLVLLGDSWTPLGLPDPTFGGIVPDGMPSGGGELMRIGGKPLLGSAPIIGAVEVTPPAVPVGVTAEVRVYAMDPAGSALTYSYRVVDDGSGLAIGTITGSGATATYSTPPLPAPGEVLRSMDTIEVTVTNAAAVSVQSRVWVGIGGPTP
jgi:hypothetical protein